MSAQHFLQSNTVELIFITALHALIILIPLFAAATAAARRGITDPMILLGIACVFSGLHAYLLFWIWLIDPNLGFIAGIIALITLLLMSIRFTRNLGCVLNVDYWKYGVAIWFFFSLFMLSAGLAPGDYDNPLSATAARFTHSLPIDNQLPYIFSQQIAEGKVQSPMIAGWLGSDRPPLQTAYFLASGTAGLGNSDLHYQVVGTLLQCMWIFGLIALLRARSIDSKVAALVLPVAMFSGLSLVHSIYVWPKLLPVLFLVITFDTALRNRSFENKKLAASVCGVSAALAMLSHGGSVFLLLGLAMSLLILRKLPSISFLAIAASAALSVSLTWTAYQKLIDPPGDRLLKWHLAGVIQIDDRSFVAALTDSYKKLRPQHIARLKLSNFQVMIGNPSGWIPDTILSTAGLVGSDTRGYLRAEQFFGVLPSLGVLTVALIALPFKRAAGRLRESELAFQLIVVAVFSIVAWGLLLFGPRYTVLHAGSLATVLFLYFGITLLAASRSMIGATAITALSISSTGFIYFGINWKESLQTIDTGMAGIAMTSLGFLLVLLIVMGKSKATPKHPSSPIA